MTVEVLLLALQAAAATAHGPAAQEPSPPTFGVRVENVDVDAFVTQGGRPVAGLRARDFDLEDDGVPQTIELVGSDAPLPVVLAFDSSGSLAGRKLDALRAAGGAFLDRLRARDPVGLLAFRQEVEWMAPPTTDRGAIRAALGRLHAGGATAALDALYAAIVSSEAGTRRLVVLFSDGQDNSSWLDEAQVQMVARRSSALVYVVALRPETEPGAPLSFAQAEPEYILGLRRIAEATGGRLLWADSPALLANAFASIAATSNERCVLRYEPQGVAHAGWHSIRLRLRGRKGDVRARPGYWVGTAGSPAAKLTP